MDNIDTKSQKSGTVLSKESSFGKALASSTFSEPSKHTSVFTVFSNKECGEPLETHHLCLNFTPTDDDDDYSQRKCCEFWKYINSRRDLRGMMVRPVILRARTSTNAEPVKPKPRSPQREAKLKTAVSMLQLVEDKGMIDRAFEAKMQQSRCSLGANEYENGTKADITKCTCPVACSKCSILHNAKIKALCEELTTWDVSHPKSMEPPGHPPSICSEQNTPVKHRRASKAGGETREVPFPCPRVKSPPNECGNTMAYCYDAITKKSELDEDFTEPKETEINI